MNTFLKVALCCLVCVLTACNKTGAYGFKEGEIYETTQLHKGGDHDGEYINVKIIEAGVDYIIFTEVGAKKGDYWYKKRVVQDKLRLYARLWTLKE